MEKLAAGACTTSGSKNPDWKANHWPSGAVSTEEEGKKVRRMAAERQEMNGLQPSSNEVEGDFIMCEVEEQQAARLEVKGPERRAVIRVDSEKTQDYVRKRFTF